MSEQAQAEHPSDAPLTWVAMAGYTVEKLHTNILARSLESSKLAAKELAAELWRLACDEPIAPGEIGKIKVQREATLGKGRHSVVDLLVEFSVRQETRTLAIEVKVDGSPSGQQLATMAKSYKPDANRHLVLLCLGGAQACRLEDEPALQKLNLRPRRWSVEHILKLAPLIETASPALGVTRDWLTELTLEQRRRTLAFADAISRAGCTYRGRIWDVYRYGLAADALAPDHGFWDVSDQRNGVVMTERSKRHEFTVRGKKLTVFLQVAKGVLRVKAGSRDESIDPREATKHLLKPIRAAMEAHQFTVKDSAQKKGQYVSLLKLDAHDVDLSREPFLTKLRRAYAAWNGIAWPK